MRKMFFIAFLFVAFVLPAQQDEGLYNTARLLIHGEDPVGVIIGINDNALYGLMDYAMKGTDPKNVKQLNDDDAWLLSMLCFIEDNRRVTKTNSEFLVYLQERKEWLATQPITGRTGRAQAWVDVYDFRIRLNTLSVGR